MSDKPKYEFSGWSSVSSGVTIQKDDLSVWTINQPLPTHATRDPNLADTPDDQIKWEPMTAFIEYYEDTELDAAGFRWFCTTGEILVHHDPSDPDKNVWHHYYKASPYVRITPRTNKTDRTRTLQASGFPTREAAQAAAVQAMRGYVGTAGSEHE